MWGSSSGTISKGSPTAGSSTMLSLTASASYSLRNGAASVNYVHGTTGGAGYMLGAKVDSVSGNYSRELGKNWSVGVTGSYSRSTALVAADTFGICYNPQTKKYYYCVASLNYTPVTNARIGGVQTTRKLGRYLNFFASYTAINQSTNLHFNEQISGGGTTISYSANENILNGMYQVISFGIGYSPRERRIGK
jgi:hypothetical protein